VSERLLSLRLFDLALKAFPRGLRSEFGPDMREAFSAELARLRSERGRRSAAWFAVRACADVLISGIRVRGWYENGGRWRMGIFTFDVGSDVRQAMRSLRRSPGFSLMAVGMLALGIGANTAIFSVVNGVLLRSLPYPDAHELMVVEPVGTEGDISEQVSWPDLRDWRAQSSVFRGLAGTTESTQDFRWDGEAEQIRGARATANLFEVLGTPLALGRSFSAEEDREGGPRAVILSWGLWQRRFGGDPGVLDRTVSMGGEALPVVGVAPRGLRFPDPETEFWVPMRGGETLVEAGLPGEIRTLHFISAVARLQPGMSAEAAGLDLTALTRRIYEAEELDAKWIVRLTDLRERTVSSARLGLAVLLGAVALVLLIACANVAGLVLTRGIGRRRELALRGALGASRGRLVRQLLAESLLLSAAGAGLGLGLAMALSGVLVELAPPGLPRMDEVRLDVAVLGYTAVIAAFSAVLFGLVPALGATRGDMAAPLRDGGRGSSSGRGLRALQEGIVVAQMALAVVLLVGGGLLAGSLLNLLGEETGFQVEGVLTAGISLPVDRYDTNEAILTTYDAILERLEALPSITAASYTYSPPLTGNGFRQTVVADGEEPDPDRPLWMGSVIIQGDYFAASGTPLVAGRNFSSTDGLGAPPVAIVSEAMARMLWGDEDPLGKRFSTTGGIRGTLDSFNREFFPRDPYTVVGVAPDMRRDGVDSPPDPEFYRPHAQVVWPSGFLVVRTRGEASESAGPLLAAIREVDPAVPVPSVRTMSELRDADLATPRFRALLVGTFAGLAALLASLGIYALMAFIVATRTRELGIRLALGAGPSRLRRGVFGRTAGLALVGIGIGLVASGVGGRVLESMLYGVEPGDAMTLVGVVGLIMLLAMVASWLPARRASRVDPAVSLSAD